MSSNTNRLFQKAQRNNSSIPYHDEGSFSAKPTNPTQRSESQDVVPRGAQAPPQSQIFDQLKAEISEIDDQLNRTNTLNFDELKTELDKAKKEIQTEEQQPIQPHEQRNQRQTLLVSQHKDVNPMMTESSNESLRDLSAGPYHNFDISPLEGEDGEISRITQLVSGKRSQETSTKGTAI